MRGLTIGSAAGGLIALLLLATMAAEAARPPAGAAPPLPDSISGSLLVATPDLEDTNL